MFTWSGRNIGLEPGSEAPTVKDVAMALSRIPRWAGSTLRPFSVLQHSLVVWEMATAAEDGAMTRLRALWHDAHEFATGDIPRPFKSEEQRDIQNKVQHMLWTKTLELSPFPFPPDRDVVKELDEEALNAEAHLIVHPAARNYFPKPRPFALSVLFKYLDIGEREAVEKFINLTNDLWREVSEPFAKMPDFTPGQPW